jgi:predicted metalloprotease
MFSLVSSSAIEALTKSFALKIIPLKAELRLKNMADEMMNEQGGNMGGSANKGGKAWGWVVLIIIILLVIWGLFALGDNTEEVDVDGDTMEEIEDDLEDTDAMEEGDAMDNIEAEVEAGADAE